MLTLDRLVLANWKSFGETRNEIPFSPLTLLVGPNAAGKSNVLDALKFLQGAAHGYPLFDVLAGRWEGQREIWAPIRGRVAEAARSGHDRFSLATTWRRTDPAGVLAHRMEVETSGAVRLVSEALTDNGLRVSETAQSSTVDRVRECLRNLYFLALSPSQMRDYRPAHATSLGAAGENLSPFLASQSEDQLGDIVDWLGELCSPLVSGIDFDRTRLDEVMFSIQEGTTRVSARSVSDGTLRFLGLVTALLTSPPGTLLIMEEPDIGLHPARVHLLASLLEQSAARGIQIIATTHSPTLLAHLSPSTLENVVALGRDADGVTCGSRLGDFSHFETLRDSGQLEHLVSTGWIERAL